jgi:hypothetical protein
MTPNPTWFIVVQGPTIDGVVENDLVKLANEEEMPAFNQHQSWLVCVGSMVVTLAGDTDSHVLGTITLKAEGGEDFIVERFVFVLKGKAGDHAAIIHSGAKEWNHWVPPPNSNPLTVELSFMDPDTNKQLDLDGADAVLMFKMFKPITAAQD